MLVKFIFSADMIILFLFFSFFLKYLFPFYFRIDLNFSQIIRKKLSNAEAKPQGVVLYKDGEDVKLGMPSGTYASAGVITFTLNNSFVSFW